MAGNTNLHIANKMKQDEFYTPYELIERELIHYKKHFKDKVVYLNCDNPYESKFFKYFIDNFNEFQIKKLITSYKPYREHETPIMSVVTKVDDTKNVFEIEGNYTKEIETGDFRSDECIELLKQCDLVVTNPPFSLFREFTELLFKYNKKFLILGTINVVKYVNFFPHLIGKRVWLGKSINGGDRKFYVPDEYIARKPESLGYDENGRFMRINSVRWWTNLDYENNIPFLELTESYSPEKYPKYDNKNAINVNRTKDIPHDYHGIMGVPITWLDKFNSEQFDFVGINKRPIVGEKALYTRLLIKHKTFTI